MKILAVFAVGSLAAGLMIVTTAQAQSLSGQEGKKRYVTRFSSSPKDPCKLAYKAYVAASGHSAYAQTPGGYSTYAEAYFCGIARNAPTIKAAEERALADCKRVGDKYKVRISGRCEVYASK